MNEPTKIKNAQNETIKAGCVVVSDNGEVLLVSNKERTTWTFPKGHTEEGETVGQAALREVKEETGYSVELIRRLSDVCYVQGKTGELIRVSMFLAKPIGMPEVGEQQTVAEWFTIKKAHEVLYHNLVFLLEEIS